MRLMLFDTHVCTNLLKAAVPYGSVLLYDPTERMQMQVVTLERIKRHVQWTYSFNQQRKRLKQGLQSAVLTENTLHYCV